MNTKTADRKFYLDWLRILAISTVFLFHSLRFFDISDWHVKNPLTSFLARTSSTFWKPG